VTALLESTDTRWQTVDLMTDWQRLQPAWDDFVERHPKGSIFHTSDMIRVYRATKGHKPLALAAVGADGEIIALLAAVRVQTLPGLAGRVSSRSIFFAEPLCNDDPHSIDALTTLIAEHDRMMQRNTLFTEVRPLMAPGSERIAFERCGYKFLDYLNYIVDVSQPVDVLWSKLRRDAKQSLKKADKAKCEFREIDTPDGVEKLYHFLRLTYGHARVPLTDRSLFDAAYEILHPTGVLRLKAAIVDGVPAAMHATLLYKDRVYDWYAGTERRTGFSPLDFLKWRTFLEGHELGYRVYDFGGAGWPDEPYGVRDYKAKFGGDLVRYGRYRKVYSPWKLALAERAYAVGRKIISPK
jgi:serine/alanine adding enzyme